jgi:hypothetical protein
VTNERQRQLIEAHREMRKQAFQAALPGVEAFFNDARQALLGAKHASELTTVDVPLVRHFAEP